MGFKLREYQEKGITACVDILQSSKKTCKELVIAPTGGGKSIYVAETVKRVQEPILVLQPSKELLLQNYEKFLKVGGTASICCASLKVKTVKGEDFTQMEDGSFIPCREVSNVTYATVGTVKKYANILKQLGVKKAIIDECFPYRTPVVTINGTQWLGEIHKKIQRGGEVTVKSLNEKTGKFEFKRVVASKNNGVKDTIKVFYSNSSNIECTPNHKFLTAGGWVEANKLVKGDAILCSEKNANVKTLNLLNNDQRDLVTGSSLGDGCLDYRKEGSYSARVKMIQGEKQKNYLYWKASILNSENSVYKINNNGYSNKIAYAVNTKVFYFHENNKNYISQIDSLNFKSLAILWMDAGSLSKLNNAGTLYSLCDNEELVIKLNSKLKDLGIRNTVVSKTKSSTTQKEVFYIRFRKSSIEDLSKYCAKYIHPELKYKILPKYRNSVGSYKWSNKVPFTVKLFKKIESYKKQEVFDIEVEGNHNFIISSKSAYKKTNHKVTSSHYKNVLNEGVVVHNCHLSTKAGSQVRELFKQIGITHVVGLTATPLYLEGGMQGASLKMMNRARWKMFSEIRYVTQISHLVKNNFWSKLLYQVNDTDETYLKENSNGSDFTVQSQKNYYKANNLKEQITEEVQNLLDQGRKSILVFVPTIAEAEELFAAFPNSATVHSKMDPKSRDYIVKAFKDLTIPVIFNVNVLAIGFDHPELDGIITARSTSSIALFYQQIGRGVRIHPGKDNCKIVDFSGNIKRFGRVEGLHFENIPYYGWGLFNDRNELLTDFPIKAFKRPTKETLIEAGKKEANPEKKERPNPEFNFGMFKGRKFWDITQSRDATRLKSYVSWLYDKHVKGEWNFFGKDGELLKSAIREYLKLSDSPVEKPTTQRRMPF